MFLGRFGPLTLMLSIKHTGFPFSWTDAKRILAGSIYVSGYRNNDQECVRVFGTLPWITLMLVLMWLNQGDFHYKASIEKASAVIWRRVIIVPRRRTNDQYSLFLLIIFSGNRDPKALPFGQIFLRLAPWSFFQRLWFLAKEWSRLISLFTSIISYFRFQLDHAFGKMIKMFSSSVTSPLNSEYSVWNNIKVKSDEHHP